MLKYFVVALTLLLCPVAIQAGEIVIDTCEVTSWEYQPVADRYIFTAPGIVYVDPCGGPIPAGWKVAIRTNQYGAAAGGSGGPDANGCFEMRFAISRQNIPLNGQPMQVELTLVNLQLRQFKNTGFMLTIPNPLAP